MLVSLRLFSCINSGKQQLYSFATTFTFVPYNSRHRIRPLIVLRHGTIVENGAQFSCSMWVLPFRDVFQIKSATRSSDGARPFLVTPFRSF